MKNMTTIINGMIIGIANIIPGVSGASLMVSLGIYENVLDAIKKPFKNKWFLIQIGIGAAVGFVLFSNLMSWLLIEYKVIIMFLIIGLIVGGTKGVVENDITKFNIFYFLIGIASIFIQALSGVDVGVSWLSLFLVGFLAGATMIIPGISGSLLLVLFGLYQPVLSFITEISRLDFSNAWYIILFGAGIGVGVVATTEFLRRIMKSHKNQFMNVVLGLLVGSIIVLVPTEGYNWWSLLSIPLLIGGYYLANFSNVKTD